MKTSEVDMHVLFDMRLQLKFQRDRFFLKASDLNFDTYFYIPTSIYYGLGLDQGKPNPVFPTVYGIPYLESVNQHEIVLASRGMGHYFVIRNRIDY